MLHYRFPGSKIISKQGAFSKTDESSKGFIVSNYSAKEKWVFKESKKDLRINECKTKFKEEVYTEGRYIELGNEVLTKLRSKKLKKLVLSRIKEIAFSKSKAYLLFEVFCQKYPKAFVYFFEDHSLGSWIGVSPELLLKGDSNKFVTNSIAGTKLHDDSSKWKSKEIEEQSYVSKHVLEILEKLKSTNIKINDLESIQAGPVKHLKTEFQFDVNGKKISEIIDLLHPTPAVVGYPKIESQLTLDSIEKHNRELYTGYLGFVDDDKVELYVNLRCAKIENDFIYLYLGGGYTSGSVAQKEWEETENKARTFTDLIDFI